MKKSLKSKMERIERESIQEIISHLANEMEVPDSIFDATVYSAEIQELSKTHWSPIKVILEAIKMIEPTKRTRVLDIGSGCGKFCLVASLSSSGNFFGIEIRPNLHEIAIQKKEKLRAENIEYLLGDMANINWSNFDAFYLYNPFFENIANYNHIDHSIPLATANFIRYTATVTAKLRKCKLGTKVVTYHGFGGDMPKDYFCEARKKVGSGELNLWVKR